MLNRFQMLLSFQVAPLHRGAQADGAGHLVDGSWLFARSVPVYPAPRRAFIEAEVPKLMALDT